MAEDKKAAPAAKVDPAVARAERPAKEVVVTNNDVTGADKVAELVKRTNADVHDDHVVWGAHGFRLTMGDLREIAESVK